MKIAIFTDTFAPEINGVCNTLQKLSQHLHKQRIEHLIFAPEYEQPANDAQLESFVTRVKSVRAPFYANSRIAFPMFAKIKEIADQFKPDLVHITTALPIGWCGLKYAQSLGLPIVMSYHTNFDMYLKYYRLDYLQSWLDRYMNWFHSHATLNLAPSHKTRDELIAKGFHNVGVWSRGIDCSQFQPAATPRVQFQNIATHKTTKFLYVGRLAAEKNLDLLLSAIARLNRTHPGQAAFVFTGDGPYRETLETCGLTNIELTGFKSGNELAEIYRSADCFVFPSSSETFGNVMLEAMASGLPVICADRGGQLDFAYDGYNALHFHHESEHSLYDSLIQALESPAKLHRLSLAARTTAVERSWDQVFEKLVQDYEQVIRTTNSMSLPA